MLALVLGSNGQDGTFLTRHLLALGHRVIGVGRAPGPVHPLDHASFSYVSLDVRDGRTLTSVLDDLRPQRIFHVAAMHASACHNQYEPIFCEMLDVNVGSVHTVLEHLRSTGSDGRLLYASSGKVFGNPLPAVVDEATPKVDSCLYSITKNTAGSLIRHYRRAHGVKVSQLYLFNHESYLRPGDYFVPKLVRALCGEPTTFSTLSFHCDWGSADEYMSIAIEVLERAVGEDFVVATGRCLLARDLVDALFLSHQMDVTNVAEEVAARPSTPYLVDTSKLERLVGRVPRVKIEDIVESMVDLRRR